MIRASEFAYLTALVRVLTIRLTNVADCINRAFHSFIRSIVTVTLGECLLASVTILDLHLRFRMYHQINLFTVMFYDKRRKRQCIEQRSAASIRQCITYVVIINIVFYANSIRRSATLANFATKSSTDNCCSQHMLTSMIPTVLDTWWISVCSLCTTASRILAQQRL